MKHINLKIEIPQGLTEEQTKGMFLSFLTIADEVITRRKRSTMFAHFFQERLDKGERRKFRILIGNFQRELWRKKEKLPRKVQAATEEGIPVTEGMSLLLRTFQTVGNQNVSNRTNGSLQKV